jgi:general L-amino acid transport system substrate-binding protein
MVSNKRFLFFTVVLVVALLGAAIPALAQEGGTLQLVRERGKLICGVNQELLGFGYLDPNTSEIVGFDIDFCKAYAAAIFGEASAATLDLNVVSTQNRLTALAAGEIDVLVRNTTWTLTRDTENALDFGPTNFYDGQTLMVRAGEGLEDNWDALDGVTICSTAGTTTEKNATDAMNARGLSFELLTFESTADTMSAFVDGRCDVETSDRSQLVALAAAQADPAAYYVWQENISKEPLGPAYRQNDSQFADVINWTSYGLVQAEEFGITSANIDEFLRQDGESDEAYTARVGSEIARFLDGTLGIGGKLGLANDFMANVIRAVGNYGEIFERHLGTNGLGMERGYNGLWSQGGLQYAPAWR